MSASNGATQITNDLEVLPMPEAVSADADERKRPAAVLKGGTRGVEALVDSTASAEEIVQALADKLAEAPGFFRGNDVKVRVDGGPLAAGTLARVDEVAAKYGLRIVEVTPVVTEPVAAAPVVVAVPVPAPVPAPVPVPVPVPAPVPVAAPVAVALPLPAPPDTIDLEIEPEPEPVPDTSPKIIVGPVRSGVILHHPGHLFVLGDVNPGAEVRAEGNIVVLGRLKGTAHAGIGKTNGFIIAIRLEPQQIRICKQVARPGENDAPGAQPEIAYVQNGAIVVERYQGRLPGNLTASI
jgi:septum site-determining protein MinC